MQNLAHRSNIIVRTVREKPVLLYEDHRTSLAVLDHAKRHGVVSAPPTLVLFDRHDDAKPPQCGDDRVQAVRNAQLSQQDFWQFVEWDLSPLDDDWVRVAMDLGLVGDLILIGAGDTPNIDAMDESYRNSAGTTHRIFKVSHLWEGLGYQGWLSDSARRRELQPLWDLLGWDPRTGFSKDPPPLVVDIDLDCFTLDGPSGEPLGWPDATFLELFTGPPTSGPLAHRWSPTEFLQELILRSAYVAIAREAGCCGGIAESDRLLQLLDLTVFGGNLRPSKYGR